MTLTDRPSRRTVLGFGLAAFAAGMLPGFATVEAIAAASDSAQKIADHFAGIHTMAGEFVQFGPRGEQTGGKFFIQRPGKIRFNYEAPSGYQVIADGKNVVIDNRKLNTMDLYPLSKTPLKLLLDERIELTADRLKGVKEEDDLTTISLSDKKVFGKAIITLMFDPKSYELRQWTITDAQGKDTTVMIFNVEQGGKFDPKIFKIDYDRNAAINKPSSSD